MKSLQKRKRAVDSSLYIALSTVVILAALPITIAFLMHSQTTQQHAQMTLPPAPAGCHYEVADCSAGDCLPDYQKLVCPNITATPTPTLQQESEANQSDIFSRFSAWFQKWF